MNVPTIFSTDSTTFGRFDPAFTACVIFCEANEYLLRGTVNNDSPAGRWGLPGGKFQVGEEPIAAALRIFKEQTQMTLSEKDVIPGKRYYARISNVDSLLYFCKVDFGPRPDSLKTQQWISIFALRLLNQDNSALAVERQKAFDVIYQDRIWHRVESSQANTHSITLRKGAKELVFDRNCQLVVPLIGPSDTDNSALAEKIETIFGLPNISHVDIFAKEPADSDLQIMYVAVSENKPDDAPIPDVIPGGMLLDRLSSSDCLGGYSLRNYPANTKQCAIFFERFVRSCDFVLPTLLKIQNNTRDDDVIEEFKKQTRFGEVIQIIASDEDEALHKVMQIYEDKLNVLSKGPKTFLRRTQTTTPTQHTDKWSTGGVVVTAAIVAGLVGGLFMVRDHVK